MRLFTNSRRFTMDVKFWVVGFLVPVSVLTQLSAEDVSPRDSTEILAISPEISEPARAVDTIVLSEDEMEEAENRLEDSLDALEDRLEDSIRAIEAKIDTIDASELDSKISYGVQAFTRFISKSRAQGYGGGVVLQPLLLGLHLKPVYDLAHRDRVLKTWDFPDLVDGYSPVLTIGALFYGGVGKGIRVGFGGWKGDLFFGSEEQESDSIMVLKVETLYGGLLAAERSMLTEDTRAQMRSRLSGTGIMMRRKRQKPLSPGLRYIAVLPLQCFHGCIWGQMSMDC
jgi:hypothetical protein